MFRPQFAALGAVVIVSAFVIWGVVDLTRVFSGVAGNTTSMAAVAPGPLLVTVAAPTPTATQPSTAIPPATATATETATATVTSLPTETTMPTPTPTDTVAPPTLTATPATAAAFTHRCPHRDHGRDCRGGCACRPSGSSTDSGSAGDPRPDPGGYRGPA